MESRVIVKKGIKKQNQEDLFMYGASILKKEDCIHVGFLEALIKREEQYPTGIPSNINFALCHVDLDYIKKDALLILLLEDPIVFKNMAEITEEVKVEVVFILAFSSASAHLENLTRVVNLMSSTDDSNNIYTMSEEELQQYFK